MERKLVVFFLAMLTLTDCAKGVDIAKVNFVGDFFKSKNVTITGILCWQQPERALLLKTVPDKQIGFNGDAYERKNAFHYHLLDANDCRKSRQALSQADFRYPHKFLVLINESHFNELHDLISTLNIAVDSHFVLATRTAQDAYVLKHFYRILENNETIWEEYGFWLGDKLTEHSLETFTLRRRNLRRAHFNVNYVWEHNETKDYITTFRHPMKDIMAKKVYGPFICFVDIMNMTYTWILTDSYGYYNKTTGKFGGIIADLENKRTMFSATALLVTKERLKFVDFYKSMNPQLINFVFRRPPVSYMTGIFTLAFDKSVWLCLFTVLALLGLGIYAVLNVENSYINETILAGSFSDVLLICLEAVCQQGTLTGPKTNSGMFLFFLVFFAFMLIYVAYSAIIIVLLQSTRSLDTTEQLLRSKMQVGAMAAKYMQHYMTNNKDPIRIELYQKKIGPNGYYPMKEGMEKVRTGEFAFHVETTPGYFYALKHFTEDEVCSLMEIVGYIPPYGYLPMQKNSSFIKLFKVAYLHVAERGLQLRHHLRFVMTPKCYSTAASFKSVGMIEADQIFFIFSWGLGIAIFAFVLERITFRMLMLRQRNIVVNVQTPDGEIIEENF